MPDKKEPFLVIELESGQKKFYDLEEFKVWWDEESKWWQELRSGLGYGQPLPTVFSRAESVSNEVRQCFEILRNGGRAPGGATQEQTKARLQDVLNQWFGSNRLSYSKGSAAKFVAEFKTKNDIGLRGLVGAFGDESPHGMLQTGQDWRGFIAGTLFLGGLTNRLQRSVG
jgi:hypothetical protein